MILDNLLGNQSVIISLDVDNLLFEKLEQVIESGFSVIEVNYTDSDLLKQIIRRYPTVKIGSSGITTVDQLEQCYQAGVHFATSPGFLSAIAQTATIYSMNYIPGVATISEAMAAMNLGYTHVRPLPAALDFCTLLNKYLPQLKLFPADISWETVEHFLNLPSVATVGVHNPDSKQLQILAASIVGWTHDPM